MYRIRSLFLQRSALNSERERFETHSLCPSDGPFCRALCRHVIRHAKLTFVSSISRLWKEKYRGRSYAMTAHRCFCSDIRRFWTWQNSAVPRENDVWAFECWKVSPDGISIYREKLKMFGCLEQNRSNCTSPDCLLGFLFQQRNQITERFVNYY